MSKKVNLRRVIRDKRHKKRWCFMNKTEKWYNECDRDGDGISKIYNQRYIIKDT